MILVGERLAPIPGALTRRRRPGHPDRRPARLGARAAPATGARSTPAACRRCCPVAVRSPTPLRASTSRHGVGRRRCRDRRGPRRRRDPRRRRAPASSARLVVGGVTWTTCPTRPPPQAALDAAGFVVSLELRATAVTAARRRGAARSPPVGGEVRQLRDLGGPRRVPSARCCASSNALPDVRVLAGIADELGRPLGFRRRRAPPPSSTSSAPGTAPAWTPTSRRSSPRPRPTPAAACAWPPGRRWSPTARCRTATRPTTPAAPARSPCSTSAPCPPSASPRASAVTCRPSAAR